MKNKFALIPLLLLALSLMVAAPASAAKYTLDAAHSSVGFQVKHLAISKVNGEFKEFAGEFTYVEGQPEKWSVEATIMVGSVDTGNTDRDDHLRNSDFFDAETYPEMTFKSTGIVMESATGGKLTGDLTMHGVTRPVTLDLEFNGAATDPWGNDKVGFSAHGKISRQDFDMSFNKALETGGLVVGDEVKIMLEIEANMQK